MSVPRAGFPQTNGSVLDVMEIVDGEMLVRHGTEVVSDPVPTSLPPSGPAGGDLTGTYPNPTIAAGAVTDTKVAAANKDGVAGTASMRTLGTGAQQACAGNDSRLSDSRAPSGAAGGDLSGTYPSPAVANDAVTFAKMQNIDQYRVVGRISSGTGDPASLAPADLNSVVAQADLDMGAKYVNAGEYRVGGTKVVGAQGAAVADPAGGAVIDLEARTQLGLLLSRLRAHGIIAT